MTANDIINAIVEMHTDASFDEVAELLASRAITGDYPAIAAALELHESSNEANAATYARNWIAAYPLRRAA